MKNKYTAIILAAGLGKRMKSGLPKVLHILRGKALIDYVLGQISQIKIIDQVIVVTGYKASLVETHIKKENKSVIFARQKQLLGTADAVKSALNKIKIKNNKILILCGDTPLLVKETISMLIRRHETNADACTVLTAVVNGINELGAIERDKDGRIKGIKEKIEITSPILAGEVNSGMYAADRTVLKNALAKVEKNSKKGEYFLTDIIEIIYNQGQKTGTCIASDSREILGINTPQELINADAVLRGRTINELIDQGVKVIDPATTFIGNNVKIGTATVLYPCTFIEDNVIIGAECSLGPFIRIRKGSEIKDRTIAGNFVEINRSVLGKNNRAKHFCYLGDTITGNEVNIGAGTVVANYDGKNKHKTIIGQSAFIGCDSILVAPVTIGNGAVTGAGCVVTKNVSAGSVVAGVPAKFLKKVNPV